MNYKKIEALNLLLAEIELNIPFKDKTNPKVTTSDIGWQLDHSLKVFNAVSEWTIKSNPKDYKREFNFWRTILFPLKYIPRGKAKAPKFVLPPQIITSEDLHVQLQTAKNHISTLKKLPKAAYFKHFIFGKLSKKQTLHFLQMHTNHHLKIVRDILKT
ncbi:DUF1569 domain-containing protein [Jejuia spongiicola]|uniref:DUF1569 domain-containing protein n=1 Tax=Jejuia spongiicola TaxID=2942207 RepID=A0ABT0Q9Y3_9FLAO|nr:DUF1569 domain-containing protein [Jejuia spongiicola]MCL6293792.1 DUF1569 domain-containing protein [Jejuia spongiicola]